MCDTHFVVSCIDHTGLLLAVAKRQVVKCDVVGELEVLSHLRLEVPWTYKPVV
jgi:hypothetical protein